MWSCDQSFYESSYHNISFIRIGPEKLLFLRGGLGTGTSYGLVILHQWGKRVKTESQKVVGTNFYVCRSYKGKTGRWPFCQPPILYRVKGNWIRSTKTGARERSITKLYFISVADLPLWWPRADIYILFNFILCLFYFTFLLFIYFLSVFLFCFSLVSSYFFFVLIIFIF